MRFDNKINRVLAERNITQTELAKRLGCSRQYVSSVILGHQHSDRARYRIAHALGMKVSELWPKKNGAKRAPGNGWSSR